MLRTMLFLLAVGLVVYELGAVAVNVVQLDEIADAAARAAAVAAAAGSGVAGAESAVDSALADETGVVVDAVTVEAGTATVTLTREPLFLVADRIEPVRTRLTGHATHSVGYR